MPNTGKRPGEPRMVQQRQYVLVPYKPSVRYVKILQLVSEDVGLDEIARQMNYALPSVHNAIEAMKVGTGTHHRSALVAAAFRNGWIS